MNLFIGLMSGTSMDGIDAALVDLSSHTLVAGITKPYNAQTKNYLQAVTDGRLSSLKDYSQLNTLLGREFAQVTLELLQQEQIPTSEIQAIGSHGQTLCHDATADIPYTVQLGCAHTIAELTGITVVADFRTRDLVAGGQGAPFAPLYHQTLFKNQRLPLAIVNIGGIANLTYLWDKNQVKGYDLGPGNCLMDAWIQKHLGSAFDAAGAWAATGRLIEPLLSKLLADPYFKREQPKSIGKEYFSLEWLASYVQPDYAANDVQKTLVCLTAKTIIEGINQEKLTPSQLLVCGGGAHNLLLLDALSALKPEMKVASTASVKINPDFLEAAMFAWLAEKTLNKVPVNLQQITGSNRSVILGSIFHGALTK